jgi:quercetin dioxygenase-like cupin family protein
VFVVGTGLIACGDASAAEAAAAGVNQFSEIDAYAIYAPAAECQSVAKLAAYLTGRAKTERQKARAIFRWITANIGYDVDVLSAGADQTPEAVLRRRTAVCQGYSDLFQALAQAAGLEAVTIVGDSKTNDYRGTFGTRRKHAWNAAKIDGDWQLIDCTWGSGAIDSRGQFAHNTQDHYFCTAPEVFAEDHLPSDSKWQLMSPPLTPEEYERRVCRRPAFFRYHLGDLSDDSRILRPGTELTVSLTAPKDTYVLAILFKGEQEVTGATLTQRQGDRYVIQAVFPQTDVYILRVFVRGEDDSILQYQEALHYEVFAAAGSQGFVGFPDTLRGLEESSASVLEPLNRVLPAGQDVSFSIIAPGAQDVCVSSQTERDPWAHLQETNGVFSGTVHISSEGEVIVWAKFPGAAQHAGLLRYFARQSAPETPNPPGATAAGGQQVTSAAEGTGKQPSPGAGEARPGPAELEAATTRTVGVAGKALDLAELVQYQSGSVASRIVAETALGAITVLALDTGTKLPDRSLPAESFLQVLDGEIEVTVSGSPIALKRGQCLVVGRDLRYAGQATSPCKVLLFESRK